jgi:hypothetical protein
MLYYKNFDSYKKSINCFMVKIYRQSVPSHLDVVDIIKRNHREGIPVSITVNEILEWLHTRIED